MIAGLRVVIVSAILCFTAGTPSSYAQDIPDYSKVVACKLVKNDAERLQCYDKALNVTVRSFHTGETTSAEVQDWHITESKSAVDNSPQIAAVLESAEKAAALVLRCHEKTTDAFINARTYLGAAGALPVTYRINNDKAIETKWAPSKEGAAAFIPMQRMAIIFINSLPDNGTLRVRLGDFQGDMENLTFNLGPVSAVRGRLASACGWSPEQAPSTPPPAPSLSPQVPAAKLMTVPQHQQRWNTTVKRQ
jgi:hypothetical protein